MQTVNYICIACSHGFDVNVTLGTEATIGDRLEDADPGTGDECVPDHCPNCGLEIDTSICSEQARYNADCEQQDQRGQDWEK